MGATSQTRADYELVSSAIDAIALPDGSTNEVKEGQPGAEGTYGRSLEYRRSALLPADMSALEGLRLLVGTAEESGWTLLDLNCHDLHALIESPTKDYAAAAAAVGVDDRVQVAVSVTGGPTDLYDAAEWRGNSTWNC